MAGMRVNLRSVEFSQIENTHYFYDPAYPTTIQFCLSGKWESWDVGWVKQYVLPTCSTISLPLLLTELTLLSKTHDPHIRRIAEEAETRLVQDPHSGYLQWPSTPPSHLPPPPVHSQSTPQQEPQCTPPAWFDQLEPSTSPAPTAPSQLANSVLPEHQGPPSSAAPEVSYVSPYGHQHATNREPTQSSTAEVIPAHTILTNLNNPSTVSSATHPSQSLLIPESPPPPVQNPYPSRESLPQPTQYTYPPEHSSAQPAVDAYPPQHNQPLLAQDHSSPQNAHLQLAPSTGVILSRNRETKILLSIDGDGIRGLSALLVIESLVNAVCVKLGQRLDPHQIFDLTGGSSLGGVIAILLCRLRMQAHRAREAYKQIARQVYLNKRDFYTSLDPHAQTPSSNGTALEDEIKSVIRQQLGTEDELLLDGREDSGNVSVTFPTPLPRYRPSGLTKPSFVVTTHIQIGTNKAALIRSYQTRRITGPEVDTDMKIWEAMKATSIAPRYMPPQPGVTQRLVISPGLVDNGTAKNNPVRDIVYECRKLFRYTNDMMIIVSVGTGAGLDASSSTAGAGAGADMAHSVSERVAEARLQRDKFELDNAALMQRGWLKYFRFEVPGLQDVPLEEWCHEDALKEKTLGYLAEPGVGRRFYECVDAVVGLLLSPHGRF